MVRALLGAVLVLALAGCGGGDPKADPTPSTPPSASASPTPTPPAMPAAAKANTKAGAIAFVRHYIELINYAQATGDVSALAAVEDPRCVSCARARKTVGEIYRSGGHIEGGDFTASIDSAAPRPDLEGWSVFTGVSFSPQVVVRPGGTTSLKGGHSAMTLVVRHGGTHWAVLQWTRAS